MLVSSGAAILILKAGIVPSKIDSLGIQFSPADQQLMLKVLFWVVLYFVAGFALHSFWDLMEPRANFYADQIRHHEEAANIPATDKVRLPPSQVTYYKGKLNSAPFRFSYVSRLGYDYVLPLFLASCALYLLV